MTSVALNKDQAKLVNTVSMKTAGWLSLITLGIGIALIIVMLIAMSAYTPPADPNDKTLVVFVVGGIILQIAVVYAMGRLFLARFIVRPSGKGRVVFAEGSLDKACNKWVLIVVGILIASAALVALLPITPPSGMSMAFTFAAYYAATYFTILGLLKTGDATLETIIAN